MNNLIWTIIITIYLTSCKESSQVYFDLSSLPAEWVLLTELEDELVVYNSCDMGNLLLTIYGNNGKYNILLHGTQEDSKFEILSSYQLNDTIILNTKSNDNELNQDFKFVWINKEKNLGRWFTTYESGFISNNIFVNKNNVTDFKVIDQPCIECWGDECDEMEKAKLLFENPIENIKKVFDEYIELESEESIDSEEDKELMQLSIESLEKVTDPLELEILINVWMYYDPTDFPTRDLVLKVLKYSLPESEEAIKTRIFNKKDWETIEIAPYSELNYLLLEIRN